MKQFFKFMLASMVGFILSMIIFSVFMIVMLASIVSVSTRDDVFVPEKALLHLKLEMPVQDRTLKTPFDGMEAFGGVKALGINDIVRGLEMAANDDRIKGVYLEMGVMQAGMASVEEIRNALIAFSASGKPVVAYGDNVSQKSYYLATASEKIFVNPLGMIDFSGLSAQVAFVKELSKKLKIEIQVIRPENNSFKSAVEPFLLDKMSEANRAQTNAYLLSSWDHMLEGIGETRKIQVVRLNELADSLTAFRAEKAFAAGLVDGLLYKDQLLDTLRKVLGIKGEKSIPLIAINKYVKTSDTNLKGGTGKKDSDGSIAVIYASGNIVMGDAEETVISAGHISSTIRKAASDKKIKAIVLRINSGGGDGLASEIIWREVVRAKKLKPVVVSMGDYAASGGYYIACAAHKIVAQPNTLTGSIGVFGVIPNMQKLFNEHLGISFDGVKTNKNSGLGNITQPLTPFEYNLMQHYVDDFYTHFVSRVAKGRNLSTGKVDSLAQGRVWSGVDALEIGLVDRLGGLKDAVAIAAVEAKIKHYKVVEWPIQQDPWVKLFKQFSGEASVNAALKENLGVHYEWYQMISDLHAMKGVQARLPFYMIIN